MAPLDMPHLDCLRVRSLRELIADDAYALTFQTFGQYRAALIRAADQLLSPPKAAVEASHE